MEVAKNKAISEAWIREKGNSVKNVRDKVPVLFDFFVKCNLIPAAQVK